MKMLAAMCGVCVLLVASGCGGREGPASIVLPGERYDEAFTQTRELLIARGFELERIDATRGVISTQPKASAGVFTPFDLRQGSLRQELDDTLNQQRRVVRVEFAPVVPEAREPRIDAPGIAPTISPLALGAGEPLVARFGVVLERRTSTDLVMEPESIRLISRAQDRMLSERGLPAIGYAPVRQDRLYAGELAADLAKRLGLVLPEPPPVQLDERASPPIDRLRRRR